MTEQQAAAAAQLRAAEESRLALISHLRFPRGYHVATVFFWTQFIGLMAMNWAKEPPPLGIGLSILSVGMFATLWNARRFKLLNGVSVSVLSLKTRHSLWIRLSGAAAYLVTAAVAFWAADAGSWWLVALAAIAGGVAQALTASVWLRASRAEREPHAD